MKKQPDKVPDTDELLSLLKQAKSCQTKGKTPEAEALALQVMAGLDAMHEILNNAENVQQTEWRKYNELRADALRLLGVIDSFRGNQRSAIERLEIAMKLFRSMDISIGVAQCSGNIGVAYQLLGEYDTALNYHNRALTLYETTQFIRSKATTLGNIGNIHYYRAEYPQALEYYHRAAAISEGLDGRPGLELHLGNIGMVYSTRSDFAPALEYFERALAICQQLGNVPRIAFNLNNIGITYTSLNDFDRALDCHEKALKVCEQFGLKQSIANNLANIGKIHLLRKEYPRALEFFSNAYNWFEEIGDNLGKEKMLANKGIVCIETEHYVKGLEYYSAALALAQQLSEKRGEGLMLSNIGAVYAKDKFSGYDPVKAEECLLLSINIGYSTGVKIQTQEACSTLAALYARLGRWNESNEFLRKSFDLYKEIYSEEQRKSVENFDIRFAVAEKENQMREQKLRAEYYEQEMRKSQQELLNKSLQLVQQTEMLHRLRRNLEDILTKADSTERAIHQVRHSIAELPAAVLNWPKFYAEFCAVYPDFEQKLFARCPSLTATEYKVACMLRIGMKSREIAALLFISERTAEHHRRHIREKMHLSADSSLRSELLSL